MSNTPSPTSSEEEKIDDHKGGQRRVVKEVVIFPRYHQLDAVRKLIAAARDERRRERWRSS